jgi:hypothetical protein
MTAFLFKKFFFDLWDNLFTTFAINFGFLFILFLAFFLPPLFPPFLAIVGFILFLAMIFFLFVYLCAAAAVLKDISDYRSPNLVDLTANLRGALLPAMVLFAVLALIVFILRFTVPFYLGMGGLLGPATAFFSCWICLFIVSLIQFYPSVYYRLGMQPINCLKKCITLFFDNAGFCFFTLLTTIFFSIFIFSIPGFHLLYLDEALRLRLLKYDWLELRQTEQGNDKHEPGRKRVKIPWDDLLAKEKEKTGDRSLKSFIFPWKE